MRILVVDDEPDLEALVTQKFRRQIKEGSIAFGFAHDGVEALAFLDANRDIDMVVTDINMPRMDGLTLLGKLQETEDKMSTVIVSAYGDMANIRSAMNRGAFDFLTKPIDFADFETTIRKTISHVTALRDARARQASAERAHAALSRYFSPNLARTLAGEANALAPGGQRREIATLFTDIAGFTPLVEISRSGAARGIAQRLSRGHDGDRVRARGHRREDHRRRDPRVVRRARRPARCSAPRDRLRARARRSGGGVSLGMARARRPARLDAHRRPRRSGDRRQFRRRTAVRLHRLRRHDQRGGAAGERQQGARDTDLRQRGRRRARGRFSRPAGRRSDPAGARQRPMRAFEPLTTRSAALAAELGRLHHGRALLQLVGHAEALEDLDGVAPDVEARSDLPQIRCLLIDLSIDAGLPECERGGQPANACACDNCLHSLIPLGR